MPVTRDVLEAIHQRRSSANPGSDLFSTINPTALTGAETAASIIPVDFSYLPGNVLRYAQNITPGTTDMTAAFQAAFSQHVQAGGADIVVPSGTYLISAAVSITTNVGFSLQGDQFGRTIINYSGTGDCFEITSSGSSENQITLGGFTLAPLATSMGSGLSIISGGAIPSLTMRDVIVITGGGSFSNYIATTNCGESCFDRVFVYGSGSTVGNGFSLNSSGSPGGSATVHKFSHCSIYNVATGVVATTNSTPGLEGLQFENCDIVGIQTGVLCQNLVGLSYFVPQLTWLGGHINASVRNFDIRIKAQITIADALLYNNGVAECILLTDCGGINIHDNQFYNTGSGNVSGVGLNYTAGPANAGVIHHNQFYLGSGNGFGIYINGGSNNPVNLDISDNLRVGGLAMVSTLTGALTATTIIRRNTPLDTLDVFDTSLTFAATLSLVGIRSEFIILGAPSGATTLTALTPRFLGDEVTLSCSSASATIQHNGAANGFVLSGGANYVFPATGGRITLIFANGGFWTEIARN